MKQVNVKQQTNRPWLNPDGSIKTDEEIKTISQSWSADTWEAFLKETVEGNSEAEEENQVLLSPAALEYFPETIWDGKESRRMTSVARKLRLLCRDQLTLRQQQILRAIFWNGLSEREIATRLSVTRSTIRTQKVRALEKLKTLIKQDAEFFGGRQKDFLPQWIQGLSQKHVGQNPLRVRGQKKLKAKLQEVLSLFEEAADKTQFIFRGGDL